MNKKKIVVAISIAFISIASIITEACKKTQLTDADVQTVTDNVTAQGISQEIQNLAEQAHSLGKSGTIGMRATSDFDILSACAIVKDDSSNTNIIPDTMRINFGTSPCICHDGKYREGEIIIYYTGKFRNAGAAINIYFNNYAVGSTATDLYQISNSSHKNITNNGMNTNGLMNWTINSTINITKPNGGGTIAYTDAITRTQTAGNTAYITSANKYDLNGTSNGTAANGTSFSAQTASGNDLIKDMSCTDFFTQGELDVTPSSSGAIAINFGTGSCDNSATLTRGSHTTTITLH